MKGDDAEQIAADYLLHQGLVLIERNYRCRFGEIDLIMSENSIIIFVEVRMRAHDKFGSAAASITPAKQAKLVRAARHYLSGLKSDPACRFDALLISGAYHPEIEWIKNAFGE